MFKKFSISVILLMTLMVGISNAAFAETPDETRAKLNKMSTEVLERMYKNFPQVKGYVENAYAYVTISSSSVKLGFWGTDRGRGIAVNNVTGKKVYVKMSEVTVGLNIGAKEYDLLFIVDNEDAWNKLIYGNVKFGTEATATASDSVNGKTYTDATIVSDGVWVYQVNKKGLAVELTIKGGRISPYRTLN